jgi:hypothetical protein
VAVGRICFYSRFSLSWSGLVGFIFLLPVDRFFVAISVWFSSANRVRRPNFSCERRMRDGLWSPFQLSSLEFLAQVAPFLFATEILPVRLVLLGFLSVQVPLIFDSFSSIIDLVFEPLNSWLEFF